MQSSCDMINVIMDGLRDAGMMIGYAENAMRENKTDRADWFKMRVKKRMDQLKTDWTEVCNTLNVNRQADAGDEIADAMRCMIRHRMDELNKAYEDI